MKTLAALSLFTLAPALLTPGTARAQEVQPPPLEQEVALANPVPMPEPYQPPPDPYEAEADPSQIDWPQDVTAEEATVDSYDDGYDPQAYTQFQDELSPYGNWIDDGTYGRVWVPHRVARRHRLHALLLGRPLGADRVRLDLGVRLELGLGAVSLRPLDHRFGLRVVLGAGNDLGAGVGRTGGSATATSAGRRSRPAASASP